MWDGRDAVNGQVVCPWGARDILSRLCRCWLGCAAGSPANCSPQFKEVHFSLLNTPTGLPAHALVFSWCQPSHLSLQHFPLVRVLWAQCWRHDSTFGMCEAHKHPQALLPSVNAFECRETYLAWKALQQQMNRCSGSAWNKIHVCLSCFYTFPLDPLLLPVRDELLD